MAQNRSQRNPFRDGSEMELLYQDQSRLQSVASEYSHVSIAESDVKGLSNVQTLSIGEWPASASVLRRESRSCLSILTDLGVVVTTLPFFALAFAVFRAKDKEVDQNIWNIFQNTIKVAASAFPIVFAAILGRLVTKVAAWKLERGATLGILEQLMGSRTVVSTVVTQYKLRAFNIIGICLALLWLVSPLGGQSVLRIIEPGFKPILSENTAKYFNTNTPSLFTFWIVATPGGAGAFNTFIVPLNAIYTASLLSPASTKLSSMDLWGNVKIPFLSSYSGQLDSDWIDVPNRVDQKVLYSSLVGLPMFDVPNGNSSFLIESSYIEMQCSNTTTDGSLVSLNGTLLGDINNCGPRGWESCPVLPNGTFQGYTFESNDNTEDSASTWSLGLDNFIDTSHWWDEDYSINANTSDPTLMSSQATLLFQSNNVQPQMYTGPQTNKTHAYCALKTSYVESRIDCTSSIISSRNCTAVAQRTSQLPHAPETISHLSWPRVFGWMSAQVPKANSATGAGGTSDLALYYIANSSASVTNTVSYADLESISDEDFSYRLAQILNSYIMISQAYTLITGGTYEEFEFLIGGNEESVIPRILNVTVASSVLHEAYVVSTLWLAIFFVAIVVLLLAAFASVIFSHLCAQPEYLGYVSLAVRDSKHVGVPMGGGTMDGVELSRLLKGVEIRAGEVEQTADGVGILGVGEKMNVSKAVVGRRYL